MLFSGVKHSLFIRFVSYIFNFISLEYSVLYESFPAINSLYIFSVVLIYASIISPTFSSNLTVSYEVFLISDTVLLYACIMLSACNITESPVSLIFSYASFGKIYVITYSSFPSFSHFICFFSSILLC